MEGGSTGMAWAKVKRLYLNDSENKCMTFIPTKKLLCKNKLIKKM